MSAWRSVLLVSRQGRCCVIGWSAVLVPRTGEVPQTQFIVTVVDILVEKQRQEPLVQTVETSEIPQVPFLDRVVGDGGLSAVRSRRWISCVTLVFSVDVREA